LTTAATSTGSDHLPSAPHARRTTFESLRTRNYRIFAGAQLVSNTGAWVQRIAQDWLVLSITGSATAVGVTTALQFLPTLLFGLSGGALADRFPKRRILQITQSGAAVMAALLAVLTLTHQVRAWHVFLIAFGLGLITAVDNPTRQAFVGELVGPAQLRNAISLNSSVFQLGALIGPSISGVLIKAVGPGYSFALNALTYSGPLIGLALLRQSELVLRPRSEAAAARIVDVLRYVRRRPQMLWTIVLIGVFSAFTNNLAVTLASYAKTVFRSGPGGYGLLTSMVAVGSLTGALVSARRSRTSLRGILVVGAVVATMAMLASTMPAEWAFVVVLAGLGAATLMLVTSANSTVQMASDESIRGRVMGLYLLVFIGSGAIGGPVLGAIDQHLGARTGLFLAGAVPATATILVTANLARIARRTRAVGT
jgi:MFS family permease